MNGEQDRFGKIEDRLERVEGSLRKLRMVVVVLVIVVAGLLYTMQEIRRDIPQVIMVVVGVAAMFAVITLVASRRGPQTKTWETRKDESR